MAVFNKKIKLFVDGRKGTFIKLKEHIKKSDKVVDLTGKLVLPTWCDSHTHLVFADTREEEFVNRIKGLTYQEIAEKLNPRPEALPENHDPKPEAPIEPPLEACCTSGCYVCFSSIVKI